MLSLIEHRAPKVCKICSTALFKVPGYKNSWECGKCGKQYAVYRSTATKNLQTNHSEEEK